jgi:hypothetical protein
VKEKGRAKGEKQKALFEQDKQNVDLKLRKVCKRRSRLGTAHIRVYKMAKAYVKA